MMGLNHVGDLALVMKEEDTPPREGVTSELKEPTSRRNKFLEKKIDNESVNIDVSTVDNKIHTGK